MNMVEDRMGSKILALIHTQEGIGLEELPSHLPDLTWNQIFASVDALSRQGIICLRRQRSDYVLWLAPSPPADVFESQDAVAAMRPTRVTPSQ